ncbi:MAG: hypothetical protein EBR10_10760, partial [Planctomycetes bacterium]|nr:hypothetical protein [Planctomycetota bacterium]
MRNYYYATMNLVNEGVIESSVSGREISLDFTNPSYGQTGSFTNEGRIVVDQGGRLGAPNGLRMGAAGELRIVRAGGATPITAGAGSIFAGTLDASFASGFDPGVGVPWEIIALSGPPVGGFDSVQTPPGASVTQTASSVALQTGVTGIPQGVQATDGENTGNVTVTWSAVEQATGYEVFRAYGSQPATSIGSVGAVTEFADTSAVHGRPYTYSVRSTLSWGIQSALSPPTPGHRGMLPPTSVQATQGGASAGVTVSWDPAAGATGYRLNRTGGDGPITLHTAASQAYVDYAVRAGVTYSYTVQSFGEVSGSISAPSAAATGFVDGTQIFATGFGDGEAVGAWSGGAPTQSPSGQRFLGRFSSGANTILTVPLPEATTDVRLSFDLYIIDSWDGENTSVGPDRWGVNVVGGQTLLQHSFNNWASSENVHGSSGQSFGGLGAPPSVYPSRTGAFALNQLGYQNGFGVRDSAYRMSFVVPVRGASVAFRFYDLGLQGVNDESWGLDNVRVEALTDQSAAPNLRVETLTFDIPAGAGGGPAEPDNVARLGRVRVAAGSVLESPEPESVFVTGALLHAAEEDGALTPGGEIRSSNSALQGVGRIGWAVFNEGQDQPAETALLLPLEEGVNFLAFVPNDETPTTPDPGDYLGLGLFFGTEQSFNPNTPGQQPHLSAFTQAFEAVPPPSAAGGIPFFRPVRGGVPIADYGSTGATVAANGDSVVSIDGRVLSITGLFWPIDDGEVIAMRGALITRLPRLALVTDGHFASEGADESTGVRWEDPGTTLQVNLGSWFEVSALRLQASGDDGYIIEARQESTEEDSEWVQVWQVDPVSGTGLRTRPGTGQEDVHFLDEPVYTDAIRVRGLTQTAGDAQSFAVSEVEAFAIPLMVPRDAPQEVVTRFLVHNTGSVTVPAGWEAQVFVQPDVVLDLMDMPAATVVVDQPLAPGASLELSAEIAVPTDLEIGAVLVELDTGYGESGGGPFGGGGEVTESDETDNGAAVEVLIGESTALELTASDGNSFSGVDLQWNSLGDGWTYQVRRGVNESDFLNLGEPTSATQFTDTAAFPGAAYYYVVVASNQGAEVLSNVDGGLRAVLPAPTGFAASDGTSLTEVRLTWIGSASQGVTYRVKRGESANALENIGQPIEGTEFVDSTALPGVTYFYAVNASGFGQRSDDSNVDSGFREADSDGDGTGDSNDGCPNDPAKIEPGVCGCGVADTDSDGDSVPDCDDGCPNDPAKI